MERRNQEEAEERVSKALEEADRVLGGDESAVEPLLKAVDLPSGLVKVRYYSETTGEETAREYTYYSVDRLAVGGIVIVPVGDTTRKVKVSAIDVLEAEIASFKDKVKTIPAGSRIVGIAEADAEEGGIVSVQGLSSVDQSLASANRTSERLQVEHIKAQHEQHVNEGIVQPVELEEIGLQPWDEPTTAMVNVNPEAAVSFDRHLDEAKRILEIAASREILNEVDAKAANDDLTVMLELKKAIDEERKTFTGPLNEYLATINGAYKQITGPLLEAEQVTKKLLTVYKLEQQRKAKEIEELNRQAMEVARKQAELNQGEFTTDITPVPVPPAPKLTRTDQGTSGLVANWLYEVIDLDQIPREYMIPDDVMLKSIAKNQHDKKQVKGIRFFNQPGLRVRR